MLLRSLLKHQEDEDLVHVMICPAPNLPLTTSWLLSQIFDQFPLQALSHSQVAVSLVLLGLLFPNFLQTDNPASLPSAPPHPPQSLFGSV